jgi:hemerythrin
MPDDAVLLVEWDEKYAVGIPLIDDQHKELIRLTNELYQGCLGGDETAREFFMITVRGLLDYIKYHFSAEETLLENAKYPLLEEHKKQHEGFVLQLVNDVKSYHDGRKFVPNAFVRYLRDWILSHIAMMDTQYAKYILDLKKRGQLTNVLLS